MRFYNAGDSDGNPFEGEERDKRDAYFHSIGDGRGLRGRKVFVHHKEIAKIDNYWTLSEKAYGSEPLRLSNTGVNDENSQSGGPYYREYPRKIRDSQNTSITGWVKPGSCFEFDLMFESLATQELGALIWLLDLPEAHYHRFGGGKPLGFGSVQLKIESVSALNGKATKARYKSLLPSTEQPEEGAKRIDSMQMAQAELVSKYKQAAIDVPDGEHQESFESKRVIKAFLHAAKGHDNAPVRYPRTHVERVEGDTAYSWFVNNERTGRRNPGRPNASSRALVYESALAALSSERWSRWAAAASWKTNADP